MDLHRLTLLATGTETPRSACERLFIKAYKEAMNAELLLNVVNSLERQLTSEELEYLAIGYAMGQSDCVDIAEVMIETDIDDDQVH